MPGGLDLKTDQPHSARVYDYLLGGKDNFEADRQAAAKFCEVMPHLPHSMRANRQFMTRMGRRLAELGMAQFLDIGTGIPTTPNLHEAVQQVNPFARVVYVDNDPIVLSHARALLTSSAEGATAYIDADLHDPDSILAAPDLTKTLDLTKPVALTLIAVMHYIVDEDEAYGIIDRLMEPLAPGSMLALSTTTADSNPEETNAGVAAYNQAGIPCKARNHDEVTRLFRGMELLEPGVVLMNHWHPDEEARNTPDEHVMISGGVAIKR